MPVPTTIGSEPITFPLLSLMALLPLLAMLAILGSKSVQTSLRYAFAGTLSNVALGIYLLAIFDANKNGIQLLEQIHVAELSYSVGVDGTNILFIPLTAILALLALVYVSSTRLAGDKRFVACLLGYETILIGAFSALNLMQFWLWSVLETIPLIVMTIRSGTGQSRRWIVSLFLQYWVSGLLMVLAGFLFLAFGLVGADHDLTFDWLTLKQNNAYLHDETLIFILLFFGFAIRMPLFPFHGWLPLIAEHGTVASAGIFLVGLKLGIYAVIRFILPMLPGIAEQWANFALILGLISLFYGALLALVQINIRRLLACTAISQSGLLVIGIFCCNKFGLQGSLLLSMVYGLATAGLLLSTGMVYQCTRTAFIPRLGGLFDRNKTLGLLFIISALSTMIMPGIPGFDAAHLLIQGIIDEYGWLIAIAAVLGNVLVAALLLRAFQQIFIALPKRLQKPAHHTQLSPQKVRSITALICILLIGTGYYTTPWLNFIDHETSAISGQYPIHNSEQQTEQPPSKHE